MSKQTVVTQSVGSTQEIDTRVSGKEKSKHRGRVTLPLLYPVFSLVLAMAIAGCAAASPSASLNGNTGQNSAPVATPHAELAAGSLAALEGTL